MALLSKLGSVHYPVRGGGPASTARLGGIATLNPSVADAGGDGDVSKQRADVRKQSADLSTRFPGENEAAVVLYSSDDSAPSDPSGLTIVNLTLSGLPAGANERKRLILNQCHHVSLPFPDDHFVCQDRLGTNTTKTLLKYMNVFLCLALRPGTEAAVAVWLLDEEHGNAHTEWESQGRPIFPSATQVRRTKPALFRMGKHELMKRAALAKTSSGQTERHNLNFLRSSPQ